MGIRLLLVSAEVYPISLEQHWDFLRLIPGLHVVTAFCRLSASTLACVVSFCTAQPQVLELSNLAPG